jgi:hypothetical protein
MKTVLLLGVVYMVGMVVGCHSPGLDTQSSTESTPTQARPVVEQPLPAAGVQTLDSIEGATVLVGVVFGSSWTSFGTGFIVGHNDRAYVVTCKHVILEASSTNIFAIPRPQKSKSQAAVLKLGMPMYHPKDGPTGTYDIAVLEIIGSARERLRALGIVPIQLRASGAELTREGLALVVTGYPVDYIERERRNEKPEPLRPLRASGTLRLVPVEALTQNGFGGTLREGYFAQTVERPLGKGASGGAVCVNEGGHAVRVVGVLLGSVDDVKKNGRALGEMGFVFASSLRIMETLQ